eukprot:Gregarina_sp_Pseudo_9__1389@NODE_192_length_3688_cov_29_771718_g177_i0_p1_GENE_NODE_192_length_3688_cov_29_771718_g177_i0NODE_192_length_3688_cov_29_771718_g177_i0_p1_ORF_typecomplete_len622_score117_46KH_1/PF00013_29/2_6e07KH_1/PF00013_29/1_2KH_1/PF00013_29/2_4KH_1/PF00013_29/8_1e05SLS/PF14611_6/0_12SLS/PF14611_6/32_NODE_192_length_3688_cov_29_771718_g177_i016073472
MSTDGAADSSERSNSRGLKRELVEDDNSVEDERERQRRRLDAVEDERQRRRLDAAAVSPPSGKEQHSPQQQEESPAAARPEVEPEAESAGDAVSEKETETARPPHWRKGVERMTISDADASFILGTGGRTKKKLARVSKTDLSVSRDDASNETILEIRGTPDSIDRAKTYIGFVMQQRVGPVHLEDDVKARDDIVILDIPHGCVGYVTGHKGQGLRSVEEEFATLMFFTDVNRNKAPPSEEEAQTKVEKLVIFSPSERSRQGAVLKVMSAIEQKMPGHFTKGVEPVVNDVDAFSTDVVVVSSDDYSYALGKGGGTRKKLARASGAILEYIGEYAYIAGTLKQRERARKYLEWLCAQRVNTMDLTGIEERDDVVSIDVPMDCVAYLTGHKGQALRRMEEQTGTFIFLDSTSDKSAPTEKLFIFGETSSGRARARTLALQRISDKQSGASQHMGRRYDHRDRDRERERERDRMDRMDRDRRDRRPHSTYHVSPSPSPPGRYGRRPSPRMHRPSSTYQRGDYDDHRMRRGGGDYYYEERRYSPRMEDRPYSHSPPRGRAHSPPHGGAHSPPHGRAHSPPHGRAHSPPHGRSPPRGAHERASFYEPGPAAGTGARFEDRRHRYRH